MKFIRAKILILAGFFLLLFFFSNDFGLIDIEKTAIITAVGIDLAEEDVFEVTLQIAVPEASATTSENAKAIISAKGRTVAEAISNIGSLSGWYQKLSFCNLLLIGKSMLTTDVNDALDYFAKSIKIQDSALLAAVDGSAKEFLQIASPLDNLSSFALQKVLLTKPGMDSDVLTVNIKTFSIGYYSRIGNSYMPYIRKVSAGESSGGSSGGGGGEGGTGSTATEVPSGENGKGDTLFDATQTALFTKGKLSGMLSTRETTAAVYLKNKVLDSGITVPDVIINGEKINFFLNVIESVPHVSVTVSPDKKVKVYVKEDIFVQLIDETTNEKKLSFLPTAEIPEELRAATKDILTEDLKKLVDKCIETRTDFFDVDLTLYRYYHGDYEKLKDNFFDNVTVEYEINVFGQK